MLKKDRINDYIIYFIIYLYYTFLILLITNMGGMVLHKDCCSYKKVYFEILRIIACFWVIFNHISGYYLYMNSYGWKQFFYMSLTMITKIGVPIFLMISGALLLIKNEDFITITKKRTLRILIVLILFNFLQYFIFRTNEAIKGGNFSFSLKEFLTGIFKNSLYGTIPYWYLYAYLGMLVLLPFYQRIAKGFTKSDFILLIVLHFVFLSLIPMVNLICLYNEINVNIQISPDFSVPFAITEQLFYPLIGYYLENDIKIESIKKIHLVILLFISLACIFVSNLCTYMDANLNNQYSQNYVKLFDYVLAITVFIFVKYIYITKLQNLNIDIYNKIICFIGSLTFGIYLFDPCLRQMFYQKFESFIEPYLPTLLVSLLWIFLSLCIGGFLTYLLKKIPYIKKLF